MYIPKKKSEFTMVLGGGGGGGGQILRHSQINYTHIIMRIINNCEVIVYCYASLLHGLLPIFYIYGSS